MDAYRTTFLVVSAVLLVTFSWQLRRSSVVRPGALRESARRAGLALTPAVEPVVRARLRSRGRATLVGTIIALIAGTAVAMALPPADGTFSSPLLLIVLTGFGATIGAAVAESRWALASSRERSFGARPRLARTPTPGRADYLTPFDQWCAPVLVGGGAVALAGAGVLIVLNPGGGLAPASLPTLLWPGALIWLIALASGVVGRVLTTRTLQRGQPAGNDVELAWSDAMRSWTLRALAQTPALGAVCSVVVVLLTVSAAATDSAAGRAISIATSVFLLVFVVALTGLTAWSALANRTPHYLIRLWPEVAAQRRSTSPMVRVPGVEA